MPLDAEDYRLTPEIIPAFPSFRAFVEAKPPAGLGTNTDLIERIIRDEPETLAMFRAATVGKKGGDRKSENRIKSDIICHGTRQRRRPGVSRQEALQPAR
jgi:hypothetical protein